ncbi:MAG: DNA-binding response regulator [Chloroflexi bacterium]|nr:MAG: DNA-binding response regulator [Chloroflexota bacterium]MBL1195450.1 DNA-binding response regulator [Chloroflexota bacterium]NOH12733.1 response regulator transcription factor [Chloroflexota bacterium]
MVTETIRVLLVDDHAVLREGLRALLEGESDMQVASEAGTAAEAVTLALQDPPDVMVIDLGLPDKSGLEAIREVRKTNQSTRIVVLSMHSDSEIVRKAMEAGSDGYVPKSSAHANLLQAIRVVYSGERFLDPVAASALVDSITEPKTEAQRFANLSDREQEVIRLAAQGYSSREIGDQLHISPKTAETYRQRAFEKLNLEHRSDLIRFALLAGILDDLKQE